MGNLTYRKEFSGSMSLEEHFSLYDGLNRLRTYNVVGETSQSVSYDGPGNITFKTGVGSYRYNQNNHAPGGATVALDACQVELKAAVLVAAKVVTGKF